MCYKKFSKAKFEFELCRIKKAYPNLIYGWKNVTEELNNISKIEHHEYVYRLICQGFVNVLIYSSVDVRTDCTRDIGSDAVRLVLQKRNYNGSSSYCHLKKHLRVETLFDNIEKTLCDNLPFNPYDYNWCSLEEYYNIL